jgi:hypothetical protein
MGIATMGVVLGMVTACAAQSTTQPGSAVAPQSGVAVPAKAENLHVQGEIIIKLKGALSGAEREVALKSLGLTSLQRFDGINADLVRIPGGENVEQAVERLNKEPAVEYAEPNFTVRIQ